MQLCIDKTNPEAIKALTGKNDKFMAWYGCRYCKEWFTATKFSISAVLAAQEAYSTAWRRSEDGTRK